MITKYITVQLLEAGQFEENFLGFQRGLHFVGVKFCYRTIVCMLQRDWSVYEKGCHHLFSNVLIGYFSSNWPTPNLRLLIDLVEGLCFTELNHCQLVRMVDISLGSKQTEEVVEIQDFFSCVTGRSHFQLIWLKGLVYS